MGNPVFHTLAYSPSPENAKEDGDMRELPDSGVLFLLGREVLLTKTKLQGLMLDQLHGERKLRHFKAQLRQVSFMATSSFTMCFKGLQSHFAHCLFVI